MNSLRKISLVAAIALLLILIGAAGGLHNGMSSVAAGQTGDNPTNEGGQPEAESVQSNVLGSKTYYVYDTFGNDGFPGTFGLPFKTINRAAQVAQPGDVILIRGGTYRPPEGRPITMNQSGTADRPITFAAYENEPVVISGASAVRNWIGPDDNGIYSAVVPAPSADTLSPEQYQVFVNGQMAYRAREPEMGDLSDPFSQQWVEMYKGWSISLRAANGMYVQAINGGGSGVRADASTSDGAAELFLLDLDGKTLDSDNSVSFLASDTRHHLTPDDGGTVDGYPANVLVANRSDLGEWERFTIQKIDGSNKTIKTGDQIALKASKGGYVSAENCGGGGLYTNSASIGACEKFVITIQPDYLVLFDETQLESRLANVSWVDSYLWGSFGNRWTLNMGKVTASSPGKLNVTDQGDTTKNHDVRWNLTGTENGRGALIGGMAALDTANEWHYDGHKLYFKPPDGVSPNEMTIEFRQLRWVMSMTASHLVFRNLDFFGGLLKLSGNYNVLDNIRVTYGSHFQFRHSVGAHNDADGGNNGVYLIGHHNLVKNSEIAYSAGNGLTMEGNNNTVENCLIHDFGYMGTVTSGVYFKGKTALGANDDPMMLMSQRSSLQHSTLFNSGRDVLEITSCWDCTFTYNHLHDSTLLTDDSGLVYADSRNLGNTEIAYNWAQGNTNPNRELSRFHLGIYLDNLTRNGIVHHNVITGIGVEPGVGMNTPREGHVIFNNTIIHDRFIAPTDGGDHSDICDDKTPIRPKTIGECSACSCRDSKNPAYGNGYFNSIGECCDGSDDCVHEEWTYWKKHYYDVSNILDLASLEQASATLVNPLSVVTAANGWEIIGNPDFRPSAPTLDGAYEYGGTNWIPGYRAVPRTPYGDACPHAPDLAFGNTVSDSVAIYPEVERETVEAYYRFHMPADGYVLLQAGVAVTATYPNAKATFAIIDKDSSQTIVNTDLDDEGIMFANLYAGDYCLWVGPDFDTNYPDTMTADFTVALTSPLLLSARAKGLHTGHVADIDFESGDILAWTKMANGEERWHMFFDASDVGINTNVSNIAAAGGSSDNILLTVPWQDLPGVGQVGPRDIIVFDPDSGGLGRDTSGQFRWGLKGSSHELTAASEKLDAIDGWVFGDESGWFEPCYGYPVSTVGNAKVTGWHSQTLVEKDGAVFCKVYDDQNGGWRPWNELLSEGDFFALSKHYPDFDVVAVAWDDVRRDRIYAVSSPPGEFSDLVEWLNEDGDGWEYSWETTAVTEMDIWSFIPSYFRYDAMHWIEWHGPDHGWNYAIDAIEWQPWSGSN
jgi:hypothetical protein